MVPRKIQFASEVRSSLLAGLEKLYESVSTTLGPGGKNVMITGLAGFPEITKDGVTVARALALPDPFENAGVMACKQAAMRANELAGDGTTTATVLTREFCVSAFDLVASGTNCHSLKAGMVAAKNDVCKFLDDSAVNCGITDYDLLKKVASTSANDSDIGALVAQAYVETGESGFVGYSGSEKDYSEVVVTKGIKTSGGIESKEYAPNSSRVIIHNAAVFVIPARVSNGSDMLEFLKNAYKYLARFKTHESQEPPPVVIISKGLSGDALDTVISNRRKGVNIISVGLRSTYCENDDFFRDICAFVGCSEYVPESLIKNVSLAPVEKMVGKIQTIETTVAQTMLVVHPNCEEKLQAYCEDLLKSGTESAEERVANLLSKVATIKIGTPTISEAKELRDRVEDSVNATKAAIESGVLPGGGISLIRSAKALKESTVFEKDVDPDFVAGYNLVLDKLDRPFAKILDNAGITAYTKLLNKALQDSGSTVNGINGQVVDAFDAGIIDPVNVVKSALTAAVAISSLYATTDCIMAEIPPKLPDIF